MARVCISQVYLFKGNFKAALRNPLGSRIKDTDIICESLSMVSEIFSLMVNLANVI